MHMNIWLVKAFPKGKMKISSHFINFKWSMNITSFTFLIFYLLDKTFPFALKAKRTNKKVKNNKKLQKTKSQAWESKYA